MKLAMFNTKAHDRDFFGRANRKFGHEIIYLEPYLTVDTCKLAFGFPAVCVFVNDELSRKSIGALAENGVKLIALRCAGFNNVDLAAARDYGLTVARVPTYSPHGVAEHAVALMLTLNRKIHRAHNRVREGNFSLEGLLGFEIYGKTVGIFGTGAIGSNVVRIMKGFGCSILAYDPFPNKACEEAGCRYVTRDELFSGSDIISLHLPLTPDTHHIINRQSIALMKKGVMLVNTSRGGLVDTQAVIEGLKSEKIGYLGLDVYEEEAHLFFEDLSGHVIQDDVFARLMTFPNVLITGHQAFFTETALANIAETTLQNVSDFEKGSIASRNLVTPERIEPR